MSFIDERRVQTREKRLTTLSNYNGTLKGINDEVDVSEIKQKIRTLSQSNYDEILYALNALSFIDETAIVIHGVIGCAASILEQNSSRNVHWYSSNLNERDTILGGDEKLRKTVLRAYEEVHARLIFIVGTPVVAINNDDVNSVILELEDEIDAKVVYITTDGFKTKTPVTGYDIVLHSLLRNVVDRTAIDTTEKRDFINVVTLSENAKNVASIVKILKDLDINFQLLPRFSDVNSIKKAGYAKATITLNPDEGEYFAKELEEVFGVKYIKSSVPIGFRGSRHFIQKLSKALGIEEKANEYIRKQEEELDKRINRKLLDGKSVFLDIDLASAIHFTEFIEKIGGEVGGLGIRYIDTNNRDNLKKINSLNNSIPVIVANGQLFEKYNVLKKNEVDYYISFDNQAGYLAQYANVSISLEASTYLGYEGVEELVKIIENVKNRGDFYDYLRNRDNSKIKLSWLRKSANWFVKQEVN